MSTIFQPPVFAGLVENLKQHRQGVEKEICVQKSMYLNTNPVVLSVYVLEICLISMKANFSNPIISYQFQQ